MKYPYRIVNVFTRCGERLSGNPLCVFEDGSGLSDADMQALALQFNLSETSFILPVSSRAADTTTHVRIFTPAMELPFAGHPTLGTAHVVRELLCADDSLRLEMKAGVIPVTALGDRWTLQANAPVTRAFDATQTVALAAALGLKPSDFAAAPLWVNAGMEQLLVPLASQEVVRRAAPGAGLEALANASGKVSVYCFSPIAEPEMLVRFFFAKNTGSVAEDPAITARYPAHFGARVNGLALVDTRGDPERPVAEQDIVAKMAMLAEWGGLAKGEAERACQLALDGDDAAAITTMLEEWLS